MTSHRDRTMNEPRQASADEREGPAAARGRGAVEVLFLIDRAGRILWSDASTSPVALPDHRGRWEAIWGHRAELAEIAHSHPVGPLAFSAEDEATMEALTDALGQAPLFSVVTPDAMLRRQGGRDERVVDEPWWAALLRRASGARGAGSP